MSSRCVIVLQLRWANLVDRAIYIFKNAATMGVEQLRADRILAFTTLILDCIGDHPSAALLIAELPDSIAVHVKGIMKKFKEIIFQNRLKHSMYTCWQRILLHDIAVLHSQVCENLLLPRRVCFIAHCTSLTWSHIALNWVFNSWWTRSRWLDVSFCATPKPMRTAYAQLALSLCGLTTGSLDPKAKPSN